MNAPPPAKSGPRSGAEILKDVSSFGDAVLESLDLKQTVDAHPIASVAAATAAGYVAGGGLFSSTTARLTRLLVQAAAVPAVREALLDVAEAALDGAIKFAQAGKPPPKGP